MNECPPDKWCHWRVLSRFKRCICFDDYNKMHPIGLKKCICNREDWPYDLMPLRSVSWPLKIRIKKMRKWNRQRRLKFYKCNPFNYRFVSVTELEKLKWQINDEEMEAWQKEYRERSTNE